MGPIKVRILNSESDLLKSFQELARYQNDYFSQINIVKDIMENDTPQFDLGIDCLRDYQNRAEILLLDSNPYERGVDESFADWKARLIHTHNYICQYKKVITVNKYAYKALVFKHSQKIYLSELPKSLKIVCDRLNTKDISDKKLIFVVDSHEVYQINQHKITISGLIDVVQIKKGDNLTNDEYQKLLSAKAVYWMSQNCANFDGIAITPNLLSLSGIFVNTHTNSKFKTINGLKINEILAGFVSKTKNTIDKNNNLYLDDQNILVNYLKKHI